MRWTWALWLGAVAVGVWLAVRWWVGRPVVLSDRWSAPFVRTAIIVALALTAPIRKVNAGPDATEAAAPSDFPDVDARVWAAHRDPYSAWGNVKRRRATHPTASASELPWPAIVKVLDDPHHASLADLHAALAEAEEASLFDPWLGAHVWRASRSHTDDPAELARLYEGIRRHARVSDALGLAAQESGGIERRAWMSKAAPPPGWERHVVPDDLVERARGHYGARATSTWDRDGVLHVKLRQGEASRVHATRHEVLRPGTQVAIDRLDVILTRGPVLLDHPVLGPIGIPEGTIVTAWTLADHLSDDARAALAADVKAAADGDEAALARVSDLLLVAHPLIRAELATRPDAPGAPALRTLLTLFEE